MCGCVDAVHNCHVVLDLTRLPAPAAEGGLDVVVFYEGHFDRDVDANVVRNAELPLLAGDSDRKGISKPSHSTFFLDLGLHWMVVLCAKM